LTAGSSLPDIILPDSIVLKPIFRFIAMLLIIAYNSFLVVSFVFILFAGNSVRQIITPVMERKYRLLFI